MRKVMGLIMVVVFVIGFVSKFAYGFEYFNLTELPFEAFYGISAASAVAYSNPLLVGLTLVQGAASRGAGPSPITRRLKTLANPERAQQLYQCSGRFAHDVLGYLPTYRGWLKKKPARARRSRKGKASSERLISTEERETIEAQPLGDLRGKERVPVDRSSPDPLTPDEGMPPKIDLAARLAEMAKSKKAPTKRKEKPSTGSPAKDTRAPKGRVSISEGEPPAKRPRDDTSVPERDEGVDERSKQRPEIEVLTMPWTPALLNAEGRSVMNTDSVHADPRLGLGLLQAVALKNDMARLPSKLEDNLYHCSSLVVQAGQSVLRLHDQVLELNGTAKRYKHRADAALEKVQTAETRAEELRTENEKLKKELAELRERSDRRLEKEKTEHAKVLEEAKKEAYDAGFVAAGEAYAGDILKLVKDGERKGFGKGYLHCCAVFGVAPEDPKYVAPPMPDSPEAEDLDGEEAEDEETEKSLDDSLADKVTDEATSSGQIPSEKTPDQTIDIIP